MITQIKYHNFRILQDATLPLGRVTVLIGPNGSGKTTALQGIMALSAKELHRPPESLAFQAAGEDPAVEIQVTSEDPPLQELFPLRLPFTRGIPPDVDSPLRAILRRARVYTFDPAAIANPSELSRSLELEQSGRNLASVLTTLQDHYPERYESLNNDLRRWMPEFDRILLDTVANNQRAFLLRTAGARYRIPAQQLSHGSLIAMALLTLSYLPAPPSIIGLEEIDRGIHPRLLREVQDALHRLAFPKEHGDDREPVQVILTTHSPYFIDLFRDTPEDIVIAEKNGQTASFQRLTDMPHAREILGSAPPLGDLWYSGVLGGVPVEIAS